MTSPAGPANSPDPDLAHREHHEQAPPPVLGSWRNLYWLLVLELALITLASYALMRWAS